MAAEAADWVEDHAPEAPASCRKVLRRERRIARGLQRAVARRAAVAVYGASQAGKSYLMSSLSCPADGTLEISYGDRTLDFLKDINPPGGDESSGLVSRFTLVPPRPPAGAPPVPVRLLSVSDIVRIVGNAFLSDFKLIGVSVPPLSDTMRMLEALPRSEGKAILDIDEIEALRDYFARKFGDKSWIAELRDAYWDWLAVHVGALAPPALLEALSPLWGQVEELGRYAGELVDALIALGQPDLAFCGVEALVPRSDSVLNVSTLFRPSAGAGAVRLVGEKGTAATLPRNVVSAIVSELVVPVAAARWDFMQHTDLLDFPGARSRLQIPEIAAARGQEGTLFLRGKVDYLFELYQANMETTATLLCVADSAQEVTGLPAMIESWIDDTIGRTAAQRRGQADALFVILTKFDRQFEEKGGADESSSDVWDKRIEASLTNFFKSRWVEEWKPGQPFNNVQWLRASTVGSLYRRDELGREGEMLPEVTDRIARRRASYMTSGIVRKHIRHYERAFDEAVRRNDGGIGYLASRLHEICESAARTEQLEARLKQCLANIRSLIRPFYHDPSILDASEDARQAVASIALALRELHRNRLLGAFFLDLGPTRQTVIALWRDFLETDAEPPPVPENDPLAQILGDAVPAPAMREDQHDRFAAQVMACWVKDYLVALPGARSRRFGLEDHGARQFADRIEALARMRGLQERIAESLRRNCNHVNRLNLSGEKQSVICVELIGRFLTGLGYTDQPPADRPRRVNSDLPIFTRPSPPSGLPALSEKPCAYLDDFFHDWVLALRQRFEESGPQFDIAANERLGTVLSGLEAVEA
nr:putative virulence factor [Gluconacetobacter dulcium]